MDSKFQCQNLCMIDFYTFLLFNNENSNEIFSHILLN